MQDLVRDSAMEQRLLDAVIHSESHRPRNVQIQIGPSGIGFCREYIRATMAGEGRASDRPEWKAAAWVGTIGGDALEKIFAAELGARVQEPITTTLPRTGLVVQGTADFLMVKDNILGDLKSVDGFDGLLFDGPKYEHLIQVSVYTLGLVQAGVLREGATARLVYWDRAGNSAEFVALPISWEAILAFVDQVEERMEDVMMAQAALESGDLEPRHELRDKPPSFCMSPKVLCPFRFSCWGGSEWMPDEKITAEEHLAAIARYNEGKAMENAGKALRAKARNELVGVIGQTPDGVNVSWTGIREDGTGGRLDVILPQKRKGTV